MHEVLVVGPYKLIIYMYIYIYIYIYIYGAVCSIVPLHTLLLDCTVQCLSWHAKASVLGVEVS
jgi:hypothetical protein